MTLDFRFLVPESKWKQTIADTENERIVHRGTAGHWKLEAVRVRQE